MKCVCCFPMQELGWGVIAQAAVYLNLLGCDTFFSPFGHSIAGLVLCTLVSRAVEGDWSAMWLCVIS